MTVNCGEFLKETLLVIVTVNNGQFLKNTLRNCDGEFAVNLIKALGVRKLDGEYLQHTPSVTVHCSQILQHSLSDCDGELR